uniref:Uncharacterized protein n=1 Tax=Rhizochromulina marina TaxID=1034831 RepID=A0A7S2WSP7_9STRA
MFQAPSRGPKVLRMNEHRRVVTTWVAVALVLTTTTTTVTGLVPGRLRSVRTWSPRGQGVDAVGPRRRGAALLAGRREPDSAPPDATVSGGGVIRGATVLDQVLLGVAALGLAAVVGSRLALDPADIVDSQSRADILAVMGLGTLVLDTLGRIEVDPRRAVAVRLSGIQGKGVSRALGMDGPLAPALAVIDQTAEGLLDCTSSARTFVLVWRGQVLYRRGVLPGGPPAPPDTAASGVRLGRGSIALQVAEKAMVNLPALQTLPGRVEFMPWLPSNTQSLVVAGLGTEGFALLGGDVVRGFTDTDLKLISVVLEPVYEALVDVERPKEGAP